jgi:TolA-binding protein
VPFSLFLPWPHHKKIPDHSSPKKSSRPNLKKKIKENETKIKELEKNIEQLRANTLNTMIQHKKEKVERLQKDIKALESKSELSSPEKSPSKKIPF